MCVCVCAVVGVRDRAREDGVRSVCGGGPGEPRSGASAAYLRPAELGGRREGHVERLLTL